jgi:hypothetical protein
MGLENRFTTSQSGEMVELRDHLFPSPITGLKPRWVGGTAGGDCLGDSVITGNDIQRAKPLSHGLLRYSIKHRELSSVGPEFQM